MKFAYFNPTVMAIDEIEEPTFSQIKSLADTAHTHPEHNDEGNPAISIRGGQQVHLHPNKFNLDISVLKNYVENKCREYISTITQAQGVKDLEQFQPVLISAWTIRQQSGDYQALHSHEAHLSGNIYLDVPQLENSKSSDAHIEFRLPIVKNPATFTFMDQWRFKPEPRKMIVFPSYIPHTVYPWQGTGHRTILAWDVILTKGQN